MKRVRRQEPKVGLQLFIRFFTPSALATTTINPWHLRLSTRWVLATLTVLGWLACQAQAFADGFPREGTR